MFKNSQHMKVGVPLYWFSAEWDFTYIRSAVKVILHCTESNRNLSKLQESSTNSFFSSRFTLMEPLDGVGTKSQKRNRSALHRVHYCRNHQNFKNQWTVDRVCIQQPEKTVQAWTFRAVEILQRKKKQGSYKSCGTSPLLYSWCFIKLTNFWGLININFSLKEALCESSLVICIF